MVKLFIFNSRQYATTLRTDILADLTKHGARSQGHLPYLLRRKKTFYVKYYLVDEVTLLEDLYPTLKIDLEVVGKQSLPNWNRPL